VLTHNVVRVLNPEPLRGSRTQLWECRYYPWTGRFNVHTWNELRVIRGKEPLGRDC